MLTGDDQGRLNWYDLAPWIYETQEGSDEFVDAEDANGKSLGVAPVRSEKISDSVIVSASCHRGRKGDNNDALPLVAVATGTREFPGFTEDLSAFDETYRIDMVKQEQDADSERESEDEFKDADDGALRKRRRVELNDTQKEALARMLSPQLDMSASEVEIQNIDVKVKPRKNYDQGKSKVGGSSNSVQVWNVE